MFNRVNTRPTTIPTKVILKQNIARFNYTLLQLITKATLFFYLKSLRVNRAFSCLPVVNKVLDIGFSVVAKPCYVNLCLVLTVLDLSYFHWGK